MTTYGLTADGFLKKRLPDIITELEGQYRLKFGDGIPVEGDSVFGEMIAIHGEREAELWEILEALYYAAYPDTASGVPLRNAVAITGHAPLPATYSTVDLTATGTPGTVLPAGRVVSVPETGARFVSTQDVTIGAGGTVTMPTRGETTGPLQAAAGALTQIETPVSGWASVTNPLAAVTGRNEETDAQLKIRRAQTLVIARGGTVKAMEERLMEVSGVVFAACKENRTDTTDANGLPPKSLQAFVIGGTDADVGQAIWNTKPAGIETYGATSVDVLDSFGNAQTMHFERGTNVAMYVKVVRATDAAYPADGDTQIQNAILAYGATLTDGDDVLNWRLMASLADIPGITSLTVYQGTAPDPAGSANTAIAANELATFDASRITVQ